MLLLLSLNSYCPQIFEPYCLFYYNCNPHKFTKFTDIIVFFLFKKELKNNDKSFKSSHIYSYFISYFIPLTTIIFVKGQ